MSRTPLFRSLRKLYSEYRAAHARGLALADWREERERARERAARAGITRRTFLAGTGLGAGALMLPRAARGAGPDPTITIVGAGIAGLNCATELADRGLVSTVYEASGRIGGRMFSNSTYFAGNQVTEWCGELIDTGHTTVRKLAHRFGLPLDNLLAAQPAGSQDTYQFDGHYYTVAQADIDFAPVFDAVRNDVAAAPFPTLFDSFTAAGQVLDHMTIYDWIESRVPGGHGSPMGKLLDVAYAIEYGADTRNQASLNLIYLLAYQPNPHGLAIFGVSDEAYHISGGNQRLPEAMAAALGVGSRVVLGHRLVRIAQTAGGRYLLTFERAGGTLEVTTDYAVLALPFAVLSTIDYAGAGFDDLKQQAITELGRGNNGKLNLQFNDRHWNRPGAWPGISNGSSYSDTGYQSSWEATRAQPGGQGIMVFYSGGSATDAMQSTTAFATASNAKVRQDVDATRDRAEPVFPGLSSLYNGLATQSLPLKSEFFKNSYAYYQPGQYTGFAGYEIEPQGNVFFCGEHTSIDAQGYMEGGAETGERTAKMIQQRIRGV